MISFAEVRAGQLVGPTQPVIIINYPVVSQGKRQVTGLPRKGMIVEVEPLAPLSGHTGVAHDVPGVRRDTPAHFVGGPGRLLDLDSSVMHTGNCDYVSTL